MNYKFGVYGDSIAFGFGTDGKSWFDILTNKQTAAKFAQNGEKIIDVINKIKHDGNHYQILILAVGINDLLQSTHNPSDCNVAVIVKAYQQILSTALKIADKIIVQAVLPIRESLFPKQDWLDEPKWAFNINIEKFNLLLHDLSYQNNALFLDAYNQFASISSDKILSDAVHLNNKGQIMLAEFYNDLVREL